MSEDKILKPNDGPQTLYFESEADFVIYGGSAGGGKTWAIVADPTRYAHVPGFRGVIFRRTFPQITGQGGLWDEAQEMYRPLGANMREGSDMDATFPSGASIVFRHLQHEKNKYDHQGLQYAFIGFDEIAHFSETQVFYLIGRARSICGVKPYIRATCNPEPGWLADFLAWWIDQETGLADPKRAGKIRYMYRGRDDIINWADSKEELIANLKEQEEYADVDIDEHDILSVTFIPAKLADNPVLLEKDPGYRGRLNQLSAIERARLVDGNWKMREGSQIDPLWIRRFSENHAEFHFLWQGGLAKVPIERCRRLAFIDTAGTTKDKKKIEQGKEPSWSLCLVADVLTNLVLPIEGLNVRLTSICFVRWAWCKQVEWTRLKTDIQDVLETWNVTKAYIENAHHGKALASELKACPTELIGPVIPGMGDTGEDAKLERAIASGMLAAYEQGKILIPMDRDSNPWIDAYLREVLAWTGAANERADHIDCLSYMTYTAKASQSKWGGVVSPPKKDR